MPRGDRTGPMGYGPMTGRGAGFCTGYATPGYANGGFGFGMGRGRGFGRMAGYGYPVNVPYQAPVYNEKEVLENQVTFLENQLQQIRNQLEGFEEKK